MKRFLHCLSSTIKSVFSNKFNADSSDGLIVSSKTFSYNLRRATDLLGEYGRELEVIDHANKALEIEENSDAYYFLGYAKSDIGKNQEALEALDKAIQLKSTDARYFYVRGNVKENSRDYKGAINDFKITVEIDPNHINAWGNLAISQKQIGKYKKAIKSLDKALEIDPKHSNNYRMRGNIKYEIKDFKEAIKDFDKALNIPSQVADEKAWREGVHADAYFNRGWAKFELGDKEGACMDWETSSELGNSKARNTINRYCQTDKEVLESRDFTEQDVKDLQNLVGGEDEYMAMMQWAEANLSEKETADFDEIMNTGNLEKSAEAILKFKEIYDLNLKEETITDNFLISGDEKYENEDYLGAIDEFNKALDINPHDPTIYFKRGNAKDDLEDFKGASDDFKKSILLERDETNNFFAYSNLIVTTYRLNEYEELIDLCSIALEKFDDFRDAYYYRGLAMQKKGKHKRAIDDLNKAISLEPDFDHAYYFRGISKKKVGDKKGACEDLKKASEVEGWVEGASELFKEYCE